MPPILSGSCAGSPWVRLVVGFGVVILSVAENYPRNSGDSILPGIRAKGGWLGSQKLDDRVLCLLSTLLIPSNELHHRHPQIASAIGLQIASAVGGRDDVWEEGRVTNRRGNTFEYCLRLNIEGCGNIALSFLFMMF